MLKIAMIGAGSVVFCKNLTADILSFPEFKNATLAFMDIDRERLDVGSALCAKAARALNANPKIESHTELGPALDGADFVINMAQVGGFESTLVDFEIPRKYGLNFTIADTTGPGGLFRALRTFPMLTRLCQAMEKRCPRAILLNYSNPMSMNMQTIARTSPVRAVGLCHSVQGTLDQILGYLGEKSADVAFICAGINHMAFYLRLEKNGQDLYPRLFEAMKEPRIYDSNRVRFELLRRLGYFVTESSEHSAEYNPWFIPHGSAHWHRFNVPVDEYLRRCDRIVDTFEQMKLLAASQEPLEVGRSHEYGSLIIHSIATGAPRVVYGNMPNRGAISSLPHNAIAEGPTIADRSGLHMVQVGELPPQLVGYMQPHVTQQELFIRAALEGRRDHVYQAAMFDPLTSATLSLDQIVEMCDELIASHGDLLPNMDVKKTLVPSSGRTFKPVSATALRREWAQRRRAAAAEYINEFHVIGPFPSEAPGTITLDQATPLERDFLARGDGTVDLRGSYLVSGRWLRWHQETVEREECAAFIDLVKALGQHEYAAAYAYVEWNETEARIATLRCGSDDGIRIWLNGEVIHSNESGRPYAPDQDQVPAGLRAGVNCMLVKVINYTAAWGFALAVSK